MLVQIRDRAALSSLPSSNLRQYLKSHGWKDAGKWGKRATIHTKKYGRRNWEILIPISDDVADYAESMAESIATLATVEKRSQLDVFYDIAKAGPEEARELVKEIYEQKERAEEAVQEVCRDFSAFPLNRAIDHAISLQEEGKAEEAIEKWRSIANVAEGIDNDLAAHAWFSIGCLLSEGDVEVDEENNIQEVISVYDQAIDLKPDYAEAYCNRGSVKCNLSQYDAAIADFDWAIDLKPDYAEAYYNRGSAKGNLGDYEAAIVDFDQAIGLNPNDVAAYTNRGSAKGTLGQPKAAVADFDRAIDLKPDFAEAYYNRGIAKRLLGDYKAAVADFDRAIHLNPDYTEAYSHRGIVKDNLGDYKAAVADFDRAIHLNPDYTEAYYNSGNMKLVLGDYEAAIARYDQTIRLNPDYVAAYCNRGIANAMSYREEEAQADFETAWNLADKSGNVALKTLIEQISQAFRDTVSVNDVSDLIRNPKELFGAQLVYDSAGETPFVPKYQVTRPPIQPELST